MGEIRTDAVRAAAGIVEGVARTVRSHVPDEVGGVASALSGSASGDAGAALATAWADAYARWATQAEQHAQAMRDAAGAWEAVDTHAAGAYDRLPTTPTGGMRPV